MRNFKLLLAYDGSEFHGWQVQPGLPTVQGALSDALARITGERVLPQGSGRTDAGVHALAQVASVALASSIPAANLHSALNDVLPASVRVLEAAEAADGFHARHSARAKTYRYRIFREAICPPFLARYVYHLPYPLDEPAMLRAANLVEGTHDFTSFAAVDPERGEAGDPARAASRVEAGDPARAPVVRPPSAAPRVEADDLATAPAWSSRPRPTESATADEGGRAEGSRFAGPAAPRPGDESPDNQRIIFSSIWERHAEELVYTVRGSGFLHHMVRNLVGTFLLLGKGTLNESGLRRILELKDRSAAGATAPACGLYLVSVEY